MDYCSQLWSSGDHDSISKLEALSPASLQLQGEGHRESELLGKAASNEPVLTGTRKREIYDYISLENISGCG